ncbi:hypothetical protein F6V30_12825 [Oryzomonas sagensis]|uniref:Uncharacterized protein n=1 Tax=Oryzomonas sagensis TaxID=2603857 RepID=A0ABQ6TMJ0_9BACT|nr:hypothetical protein [Oryzomonas sagensis]KAB0669679.1 hypothetical protein F6V30_12825 [Oryzomonas sagensis]
MEVFLKEDLRPGTHLLPWLVLYFLLPSDDLDENSSVAIKKREIFASSIEAAHKLWAEIVKAEALNVDSEYRIFPGGASQ